MLVCVQVRRVWEQERSGWHGPVPPQEILREDLAGLLWHGEDQSTLFVFVLHSTTCTTKPTKSLATLESLILFLR
jgi:hypothetical protein